VLYQAVKCNILDKKTLDSLVDGGQVTFSRYFTQIVLLVCFAMSSLLDSLRSSVSPRRTPSVLLDGCLAPGEVMGISHIAPGLLCCKKEPNCSLMKVELVLTVQMLR